MSACVLRDPRRARRAVVGAARPLAVRDARASRAARCDTGAASAGPVTLAVVNARVWTGDRARPWADAIAVRGDASPASGRAPRSAKLAGDARVIDAQRADGRARASSTRTCISSTAASASRRCSCATRRRQPSSSRASRRSPRRCRRARGSPAATGITSMWGGELPRRDWIDSVTPNNPVWVNRLDGHMALANSAALAAGEGHARHRETWPAARSCATRPASRPACSRTTRWMLVDARGAEPAAGARGSRARRRDGLRRRAGRDVRAQHGLVGRPRDLRARARGESAAHAHLRRRAAVDVGAAARHGRGARPRRRVAPHRRAQGVRRRLVRLAHGRDARAVHRCADRPGLFVNTPEDLYAWVSGADKAGLHVIVHAIGDRAIRTQLDIFERVAKENGPRDRRFRIEHAQHIAPADIPRFAPARRHREHAAVSRDRRRPLGREGHRRGAREDARTRSGRCAMRARRSRSAATGSSRRRRRWRASTPRSPAARSTTAIRTAGCPSRRSPSRMRCARTRDGARTRRSTRKRRACSSPARSRTSRSSTAISRTIPPDRDPRRARRAHRRRRPGRVRTKGPRIARGLPGSAAADA